MKTITINGLRNDKALLFAEHYEQLKKCLEEIGASIEFCTITCDDTKTDDVLRIISDIFKIKLPL